MHRYCRGSRPYCRSLKGERCRAGSVDRGLNRALGALRKVVRSHSFAKPTEISVAKMVLFLKAAQHEDDQLGMGTSIELGCVRKRARLNKPTARRCLASALDQELAERMPDDDVDHFILDHNAVEFWIENPPEESTPKAVAPPAGFPRTFAGGAVEVAAGDVPTDRGGQYQYRRAAPARGVSSSHGDAD